MKFEANIAGVPVNVDVESLPATSVAFIMEYGLRQYIQDGAAVSKVYTTKERKGEVKTDEEIEAEKADGVKERVENLLSGEFTRRGPAAPKQTPEERYREQMVMAELERIAKATGKKLPTKTGKNADPERLRKLQEAVYAKNKDGIDKEVARRIKADAKAAEDVSDIEAML
jgi:hypothetical protein